MLRTHTKLSLAKKWVWLFDLDNTLHNASKQVFPAIAHNMTQFIKNRLEQENAGIGNEEEKLARANELRQLYLNRYGATLKGVVLHHGVKERDFLHAAHQFECLHGLLQFEKGLRHHLKSLSGKKILFTNAPALYASQVIRHLRCHTIFARHIFIENMRVHGKTQPKPSKKYLQKLLAQLKVPAENCILVEDSVENLAAAHKMGIKTALVTQYGAHPSRSQKRFNRAHIKVHSVWQLKRAVKRLTLF